jgi:hypothetical protein
MTFANYPGHLVAVVLVTAMAGLTVVAFHSAELRAPRRKPYRWLLSSLQYAAIGLLLVITWNPSTLQTTETFQRNTVMTVFDTSGSMSVADDSKTARLDKAAERFAACFRPDDSAGPEYRLYGFDRQAYHCGSLDLLRRWGDETNLHAALSLIADRAAQEAPAGAVLFTDGRADDRSVGRYLPSLPKDTPILVVGVGSKTPRPDAAVKSIAAPAGAWIDTTYPVAVTITGANVANDTLTVELLHDGQITESRDVARDQWRLSGEATVEFTVPAQSLGTHVITARVTPCRGEINTANNARSTTVEVTQEQGLRVLLYSQYANVDIGKIRQALAWDKRIDLDLRLDVIRDPVLADAAPAGVGYTKWPETKQELYEYDVLVLGPCELDRLTSSQRDALYGFVTERGGGLLLLPGPDVASLAAGRGELADALLPVILDARDLRRHPPSPDAIQLSFEAEMSRLFDFKTFGDSSDSLSPYYNVAQTKPAAATLATVDETPILAAHRIGRGRVCLLNATKLFMLYREDRQGGLLTELICRLVAYLGAAPSAGTGIELFVERCQDDPRRAAFTAFVTDKRFELVSEAEVLLNVADQVVGMQPVGEGRYTVELDLGQAQSVVAKVQAQINGAFLGERTLAANLPPIRDEMSETNLDEEFLKALAQRLGATYRHIDQLDARAAKAFTAQRQVGSTLTIRSAWPTWPLLIALGLILSIKWFVRRWIGLV